MLNDEFMRLGELLTAHTYTYAKTMPDHPHEYSLRWDWDDAEFVEAVRLIRAHGYERPFYRKTYTSFDLNDHYYWTMGEPIDKDGKPWTYVLNRAVRPSRGAYDAIADGYDALFKDSDSLTEDSEVMGMIGWRRGESVLDIGCGTGLFLEHNACQDYVGIDPSRRMLSRLGEKFPQAKTICTDFEHFYLPRTFDKVIATFGAASYVDPSVLERVRWFLSEGGEAFLMFYRDGYVPRTYGKTGVSFDHHAASECLGSLPDARVSEHGDFVIARFGRDG